MGWGFLDAIPGVNTIKDAVTGNWGDAAKNFATGGLYGTANTAVNGVKGIASGIKNAYDKPFEEQKAGYQAVIDQANQIKQERLARQQATLAAVNQQYAPANKAISAVYGDPSTWKL
jgi:hypothetical protein